MIYYYFKSESGYCGEWNERILSYEDNNRPSEEVLDTIATEFSRGLVDDYYKCDLEEDEFETPEEWENACDEDLDDYWEMCSTEYREITEDSDDFDKNIVYIG